MRFTFIQTHQEIEDAAFYTPHVQANMRRQHMRHICQNDSIGAVHESIYSTQVPLPRSPFLNSVSKTPRFRALCTPLSRVLLLERLGDRVESFRLLAYVRSSEVREEKGLTGCCLCPRKWRRSCYRARTSPPDPRARSPYHPSTQPPGHLHAQPLVRHTAWP